MSVDKFSDFAVREVSDTHLPHTGVRRYFAVPDRIDFSLAAVVFHELHHFAVVSQFQRSFAFDFAFPRHQMARQQLMRLLLVDFVQLFQQAGSTLLDFPVSKRQQTAPMHTG